MHVIIKYVASNRKAYLVRRAEPELSGGRGSVGNALESKVGGASSGHTLPASAGLPKGQRQ
jgi:hypothetical protein